jgi:precorrin-6B methylase 2
MRSVDYSRLFLVLLLSVIISTRSTGQNKRSDTVYVPHVGQAGKDVVWVPTPDKLVNRMLEIAKVTPKDFLIDLGSGDGRTVIGAAKLGAHALGIEYNPAMVELSKKNAESAGVSDKTKFLKADLYETDLSEATVITMFLLPEINLQLRPKLLELKPGTRIVSNTFTMDDWMADVEVTSDNPDDSWSTALMWIIPAKIDGNWKMGQGELSIHQEFQMFYGTYKSGDHSSQIADGRLNGDTIYFKINEEKYSGKVKGQSIMSGTATSASRKWDWSATKTDQ